MERIFGLLVFMAWCHLAAGQPGISVWLDTDIGNDFDDELAISYGLISPELDLQGISTTHWRHEGRCDLKTADSSFVLTRQLMRSFSGRQLRVLRGTGERISNVYGELDCQGSEVVEYLISVARAHSADQPLYIVGLGAATNIATAICRAPDIKSKIRVYLLAAQFDPVIGIWNKNEFNVQNDLAAFDYLLETRELDLYIMPANVGAQLEFSRQWLGSHAEGLPGYLNDRWHDIDSMRSSWTAYDLALLTALAQPQWVEWRKVDKPPENGYGKIHVATYLDIPEIERHLKERWATEED